MLEYLHLHDVGPAPELRVEFGPRLNLLTGDNGLGKTFLLDVAWWALTQTWVAEQAWPRVLGQGKPRIQWKCRGTADPPQKLWSDFDHRSQEWGEAELDKGVEDLAKTMAGYDKRDWVFARDLIVYVRADHVFAVWDFARNWQRAGTPDRPACFRFDRDQLWNGLTAVRNGPGRPPVLCNGLLRDWIGWQERESEEYELLRRVLEVLSPSGEEPLCPGEPTRLRVEDVQDIPTLRLPYGDVPVTLAAAGMERILHLAYLLVWSWSEHKRAAPKQQLKPSSRITFLIDELELHLHPEWQRRILPALGEAARVLRQDVSVQVLASTHSPLVLASAEPEFDEDQDALVSFDLVNGQLRVGEVRWAMQGDVTNWLVSDTFGLAQARSIEAEEAIKAANAWMRGDHAALPDGLDSEEAIHERLMEVLAGHDPFWPRWIVTHERLGADAQ